MPTATAQPGLGRPRSAAAQPVLNDLALRALDVASMHEARARAFLEAGDDESARAEFSVAAMLRDQYGTPRRPILTSQEIEAARRPHEAGNRCLG